MAILGLRLKSRLVYSPHQLLRTYHVFKSQIEHCEAEWSCQIPRRKEDASWRFGEYYRRSSLRPFVFYSNTSLSNEHFMQLQLIAQRL